MANEIQNLVRAQAVVRPNANDLFDLTQAIGVKAVYFDESSLGIFFVLEKPIRFEVLNPNSPFWLVPDCQLIAQMFDGGAAPILNAGVIPSDAVLPPEVAFLAGAIAIQQVDADNNPVIPTGLAQITVLEYAASNGAFTAGGQPQVVGLPIPTT